MKNNKNKNNVKTLSGKSVTNDPVKKLSEKQLVVAMIRDDLVNYRLLNGLHRLGLVTEVYFLNASQTVFDYLGIESDMGYDKNYARYEELKEEVMDLDLEYEMGKLNKLAEKIYRELMTMRFMQAKGRAV